ncbi:MAG: hypothetical protein KKD44_13690 [Proteobacteria bacterium]|nr:hypothetical protein [Pseudomonadota bacterium]
MNRPSYFLSLTLFLILATLTATQAGEVTIPNAFVAGMPAVAAEVNENFTAVKAEVDDNAANISANETDISTNTADITANATAIDDNTTAIGNNTNGLSTHRQSFNTHQRRLPVAFGYVNQYFLDQIHGTSNVNDVVWNATYSRYEIDVEGLSVSPNSFVAFANPFMSEPVFINVSSVSGNLLVYIYDLDGNPIQGSFHWIVYNY